MTYPRGRYDPVVMTAAITGGDVLPSQSPNIPRGVEGIVHEALAAAEAGATCVHLHARDADGRPSGSGEMFAEMADKIREKSDVLLNFSTGGAPGMSLEERLEGLKTGRPDMATLNLGTMNYEIFPDSARWPDVESSWEREVLERSGAGVFVNTLNMIREIARTCRELGIVPECEAYDLGHLHMAKFLLEEGTLTRPVRVQLVLGVLGGAANTIEDLFVMKEAAERLLGGALGGLGIAATGYPMQFRLASIALSWGLDCRVGFEDSLRIRRDRRATSNVEFVEVARELASLVGRPIVRPRDLRETIQRWRNNNEGKVAEWPGTRKGAQNATN